MSQYKVSGMNCAACSARVEKAVNKVPGVTSCAVSLLTNSMSVEGDVLPEDIIKAVTAAGYKASIKDNVHTTRGDSLNGDSNAGTYGDTSSEGRDEEMSDSETLFLIKRIVVSVCLLIPLMYISMGHMMWDFPLPAWLNDNHIAMGITELLLTTMIIIVNQRYFINGFRGVLHAAPNMDTLVALGAAASYGYSVYVLYAMTGAQLAGDSGLVMDYMHELYFESAAMILTLITVGKMLESYSKGKTTNALKSLIDMAPKRATLIKDGREISVPVSEVKEGDIFAVKPGESIPVDGVIIDGESAVNESALTGESTPVNKSSEDKVYAATINQSGYLRCKAVKVGGDTIFSQIIRMVNDAAATKAPIAKLADKVSGIFVPVVMGIALLTFIVWSLCGEEVGYALARGISVLVISCPCALGLATPVAIMVGSGVGARHGLMYKTASALEQAGKACVVVLDKTGTVTSGEPGVTDVYSCEGYDNNDLIRIAYSLECKSEHPLAKAICEYAENKGIVADEAEEFRAVFGKGLTALCEGKRYAGGNMNYIKEYVHNIPDNISDMAARCASEGKTPLYFCVEQTLIGIIAVADVIRPESAEAVKRLHDMNIQVVMLTGDNRITAEAIGSAAGVDEVFSEVLPEGKEDIIMSLIDNKRVKDGTIVMVGDGINDAPALTRADIGIAIGGGNDIAIDAADIVLMRSNLMDVPAAVRLSRSTLRNIKENLFWAFIYNIIGIPLAAGVWIPIFGWTLNPMFGAAAMSLSSFFVVTNALRLNMFKPLPEN